MRNTKRIVLLTVLCVGIAVTAAVGQPLYAVDSSNIGMLRLMDAGSGSDIMIIGPTMVPHAVGMAMDPTTGIMYLANAVTLFTVNLATGMSTLVGSFPPRNMMLDLTCDSAGNLYGITDALSDNWLVQIDKATGATTDLADLDGEDNGLAYNPLDPTYLYHFYGGNAFEKIQIGTWARTPLTVVGTATGPKGLVYNRYANACCFFDSLGNFQLLSLAEPLVLVIGTGADDSANTFGLAFDQATTLPVELSAFSIE
ncbi:MAG TPA: hypothetical protein PLO37_08010 [Candidatus Hydrogenedentes bacterium]|nr:hypothetical protein [Candidatus Hydrogenedentota bacterium]HPG66775.1 hypothetical protein [Candidatus Hydrogenedentota bacterium]